MTERERRAENSPMTPEQLVLMERLQAEVTKQIIPLTENISAAIKSAQATLSVGYESYTRPTVSIPFTRHEPIRTRHTIERIIVPASNEILYDWEDHTFSRRAMGEKFNSSFEKSQDNKRQELVERLLRTRDFIQTKTLGTYFKCTDKQIGNMVAAINNRIMTELALKEKLIEGQRNSGYRINPEYSIFQKK